MLLKTLVIDDEPLALVRIKQLIKEYSQYIEIIGEASSGGEAVEKVKSLKPDLIFLDIQMPDLNGFEVLEALEEDETPMVVFTTAYDDYALRAYEENTIDYLLKPIEEERFVLTMEKLNKYIKSQEQIQKSLANFLSMDSIKKVVEEKEKYPPRLQVRIGDRTILVPIEEVIRFQSEEKYTTIYTENSQYLIDTSLIELEAKLNPNDFIRVHRAHLVSIPAIAEIQRAEAGRLKIILNDKSKTTVPVSRNFVKRVRNL